MNCWKSINVKREYNPKKLRFGALGLMMITFILTYLFFSFWHISPVYADISFIDALLFVAILFPGHILLHYLPLFSVGPHTSLRIERTKKRNLPYVVFRSRKPISKNLYIFSMVFPCLITGLFAAAGAFFMPSLLPYFLLLFAVNAGFAFYDYIYVKQLLAAPKHCFIEKKQHGMHILIKQPA